MNSDRLTAIKKFAFHALFIFSALRIADAVNVVAGMWFVPKYVSSEDIGAVLPLSSFATFLSLPLFAFAMTAMKESAVLSAAGEKGRLKSLLSGVFLAAGAAVVLGFQILDDSCVEGVEIAIVEEIIFLQKSNGQVYVFLGVFLDFQSPAVLGQNFLGNFQYVLIAAFGGFFVLNPNPLVPSLLLGDIHSMLQYSKKFTRPVNEIANQYASILTALAGAERIFEIMDSADEIDEGTDEVRVADIEGNIRFEGIHFAYEPDEPVLKGLDLWLKKGQNEIIVLDVAGPKETVVWGQAEPELNKLQLEKSNKHNNIGDKPDLNSATPAATGAFKTGNGWQTIQFNAPAKGRYLAIECLSTQKENDRVAIAEFYLQGADGKRISREPWRTKYANSEEENGNHKRRRRKNR